MLKARWLQALPGYLLCLVAFTIPLPFIYAAASVVLLTIARILQGNIRETINDLKQRKILWLWLLYFLLFAISYTYSDNKEQSLFDLQTKLSILILPVVIGCGIVLDRQILEKIFFFFTLGVTLAVVICIGKSLWMWHYTQDISYMFYHKLVDSLDSNAVYVAWYVMFSIALLLFLPWKYFYSNKYNTFRIFFIVIQVVFFLLLSARMLIALFFLFLVPYYLKKVFTKQHLNKWQLSSIAAVFLTIGLLIVFTNNPIRKRYRDVLNRKTETAFTTNFHDMNETGFTNLTLRLFVWHNCWENMNEHNLWLKGAGNGDAQALQNEKIAAHHIRSFDEGIHMPAMYNANLHNMFFQTLIMIGIPGLTVFLLLAFTPVFYIKKSIYGHLFLIFHITALIFMFQESALQTQAGIIYYSFFSMIFWNVYYNSLTVKKENIN